MTKPKHRVFEQFKDEFNNSTEPLLKIAFEAQGIHDNPELSGAAKELITAMDLFKHVLEDECVTLD